MKRLILLVSDFSTCVFVFDYTLTDRVARRTLDGYIPQITDPASLTVPIDAISVHSEVSTASQSIQASTVLPAYTPLPLPVPDLRIACTRCEKTFGKKGDWIRHEREFHERWQTWRCQEQECAKIYYSEYLFVRHHNNAHKCLDCSHARNSVNSHAKLAVTNNRKRRFWACGYCKTVFRDFYERCDHIAGHYEKGKTKSDWDNTMVFLALLQQNCWVENWVSFVASKHGVHSWPYFHWDQEATAHLLESLEFGDCDGDPMEVIKQIYTQGLSSDIAMVQLTTPSQDIINIAGPTSLDLTNAVPFSESLFPVPRVDHLPKRHSACTSTIQTNTITPGPPQCQIGCSALTGLNDLVQMQPYHYRPVLPNSPSTPRQDPRFHPRSTKIFRSRNQHGKLVYRAGLPTESTGVPLHLTRSPSNNNQTHHARQDISPVEIHDSLQDMIKSALSFRKGKRARMTKSVGSSSDLEQA
jgi:hypothetical protein